MLYSGADLIRASGQQNERLQRLNTADEGAVPPVAAAQPASGALDGETQGALLRFARFINKEGEKKKPRPAPGTAAAGAAKRDPYREAEENHKRLFDRGQQLDIYI